MVCVKIATRYMKGQRKETHQVDCEVFLEEVTGTKYKGEITHFNNNSIIFTSVIYSKESKDQFEHTLTTLTAPGLVITSLHKPNRLPPCYFKLLVALV